MAGDGKRVALVIGNGAYTAAPPLWNPRNDANAVAARLGQLGFEVIPGLDLGRDAMEDKLGAFEEAISGVSAAMLFYAGHGLQVKGHNYLVPVDAEIRQEIQLKRRAFSLDEVLDIMARRARASLVFLDACRDNPFSRSLLAGMTEDERGRYLVRSGLAEVKASQGSFVAFATAPDNVALDGSGSNSPFTQALLTHIETPDVSVSDMMISVRNDVLRATGGRQEPWDQSSLRERFCFMVGGGKVKVVPPLAPEQSAPVDSRTVEHTYWVNIQDSSDPNVFEVFLTKLPDGDFAGLAKVRAEARIKACGDIAVLERLLRDHPDSERVPLARDRRDELAWNAIKASRDAADIEAFIARWAGSRFEAPARARLEALRRKAGRSGGHVAWMAGAGAAAIAALAIGYTLLPGETPPPPGPKPGPVKPMNGPTPEELANAADDKAYDKAKSQGTKAAFEAYLQKYGRHADEARERLGALDTAAFKAAEQKNTVEVYKDYRDDWPEGQYFTRAGQRIATLETEAKSDAERKAATEKARLEAERRKVEAAATAQSGMVAVSVRVDDARDEVQWFKPGAGKSFQDCTNRGCTAKGPKMVVLPEGRFLMGSPTEESGRESKENPRHEVTIAMSFAVGRTHVTRGEFAAFVKATGYKTEGGCKTYVGTEWKLAADRSWRSPGFNQDDTHPVVCVNWNDAKAYAKWLSDVTGQPYRLMTEGEAEYAARGVTIPVSDQPHYFFGNDEAHLCTYANGADESTKVEFRNWRVARCKDGYVYTAPVASFKANAFGLYDVHGNAWTWVEDRWHDNYNSAPPDSNAWSDGASLFRVLRGGTWGGSPQGLRSAFRVGDAADVRSSAGGFRVARTLTP